MGKNAKIVYIISICLLALYSIFTLFFKGPNISKKIAIDGKATRYAGQNNTKSSIYGSSKILHNLSDIRQTAADEQTNSTPNSKYLVLLVEFSDVKFTIENAESYFESFFNLQGYSYDGATGSVADYFNDNFAGKRTFSFHLSKIITLSRELAYYGEHSGASVDGRIEELVADACHAAALQEIDFAQFDNDSDGYIDNVAIIFAGTNEMQSLKSADIWPQHGALSPNGVSYNGVRVGSYLCTSEYNYNPKNGEKSPATIGLFCHEFAHLLGLPDFYDVNGDEEGSADALYGSLSIMDMGCYLNEGRTPPYFNAIEREILGISEVVEIVAGESYTLSGVESSEYIYKIPLAVEGEYFLVECRNGQKWDRYCGGDGLVVYHVDKSENNCGGLSAARRWELNIINSYAEHQCARSLMPPGRNKIRELSYRSTYPLKGWNGYPIGLKLSNIVYNGSSLSFTAEKDTEKSSEVANVVGVSAFTFTEEALLTWSFPGGSDTTRGYTSISWLDTQSGARGFGQTRGDDFLIQGLEPGHSYNAELFFEKESLAGGIYKVSFKTDTTTSNYPYLKIKGEYARGRRVVLRVLNCDNTVTNVRFKIDGADFSGNEVRFATGGERKINALIDYTDGSTDIIEKVIKITNTR